MHYPLGGNGYDAAENAPGNLTVTILFANCEPIMLAYDAVD